MSTFMQTKKKFDSIKSSINTGLHYGNIKIIPKRKGELFRRLKTREMVTLLQLYIDETSNQNENIANLINNAEEQKEKSVVVCYNDENDCDYIRPLPDTSCPYL
eukprot:842572_1